MSASCFFTLEYKGKEEDFQLLWELLHRIEGKDVSASDDIIPLFRREKNKVTTSNAKCQEIWGDDFLEPSADIYLLMAKVAHNLEFEASSDRMYEGDGSSAADMVTYKDGKLVFKSIAECNYMEMEQLIDKMFNDYDMKDFEEGYSMVILGDTRIFKSRKALEEDVQAFSHQVVDEVTGNVRCIICNNQDDPSEEVQNTLRKARELNIPILSEIEYIMIFCEVEDSWGYIEMNSELYQLVTFEDFCKYYTVDASITEEIFNRNKKWGEGFLITQDNKLSKESTWNEEVYYIDSEGVIRDEQKNVDVKMMKAVEAWEKQINKKRR